MSFFSRITDAFDFISDSVGNNMPNNEEDVRKTKRNLDLFGYFNKDDDDTNNGIITREMDTGIKKYQRDNGLKEDGILHPQGETESSFFKRMNSVGQSKFREKQPNTGARTPGIIPDFGNDSSYGIVPAPAPEDKKPVEYDATGRMKRPEETENQNRKIPPLPEEKPYDAPNRPTILKGVDNEKVKREVEAEEGKTYTYMYKDTAPDGGKVTIGTGIMLNDAEKAKELPFEIKDGKGNYRKASPEEIERAFNKIDAVKNDNYKAESFEPGIGKKAKEFGLEDLRLPKEEADRVLDERIRSSVNELREKFPDFDTFPEGAQRALLDMEFNMGIKFHEGGEENANKPGRGWPALFNAVRKEDWEAAAKQSHRNEKGHAGMADRNQRTKDKFLEALKEKQKK